MTQATQPDTVAGQPTDWDKELDHAAEFLAKAWDRQAASTAAALLRWNLKAAPRPVRVRLERLVRDRMAQLREVA